MNTLQLYLENKHSTSSQKEEVKKISITEINQERSEQGITDLLEGGELDLRPYPNIEEVVIDNQFLQTPLTKIDTKGLTHLKEIVWNSEPSKPVDSEEDKKLWEELGLSEQTNENNNQKKVIRELKRISELFSTSYLAGQKINVHLVTDQLNADKLTVEQKGLAVEKNNEWDIYLRLDQASNSLFLTLTKELVYTLIKERFSPNFWQRFYLDQNSILQWINEQVLVKLVNRKIFFFTEEKPSDSEQEQITLSELIAENTYQIISQELVNLTNQELSKGTESEKLWLEIVGENTTNGYSLQISYHQENPFKEQIKQLIRITPLELELESLRKKQEQLPTTENFDKLTKQKQELENYLQNYTDEETYQSIINKINQIN